MNDKHPITPPPELVEQWADMLSHRSDHDVFALAARWGADQELEACITWLRANGCPGTAFELNDLRRPSPKPPSLKEQALADLLEIYTSQPFPAGDIRFNCIRRALEALSND
jgi:hypothetical protein